MGIQDRQRDRVQQNLSGTGGGPYKTSAGLCRRFWAPCSAGWRVLRAAKRRLVLTKPQRNWVGSYKTSASRQVHSAHAGKALRCIVTQCSAASRVGGKVGNLKLSDWGFQYLPPVSVSHASSALNAFFRVAMCHFQRGPRALDYPRCFGFFTPPKPSAPRSGKSIPVSLSSPSIPVA